jgi:hypothetical protein
LDRALTFIPCYSMNKIKEETRPESEKKAKIVMSFQPSAISCEPEVNS